MRELTQGGLSAGTLTVIPRWVSDPTPGVAGREIVLSKELAASIRRLAAELELPVRTLLLTAHAKVLAALSAQRSVVTGYLSAPWARALSCPLEIEPGTWRSLALGCASSEALLHSDGSAGARSRGIPGSAADRTTIFDSTGSGGTELAGGTGPGLRLVLCEQGRLEVQLRYR